MARPRHFDGAARTTPSRSTQHDVAHVVAVAHVVGYRQAHTAGGDALEGYMRAIRGMVGLVIVTLIGSAAFVAQPTTKAGATAGTMTVRRGDTLSAIAGRAGTTVAALAALNGIRNPDHVEVGQVLKLPAASG